MEFSIGDRLLISGLVYTVVGKIRYKNRNDDLKWFEYRLIGEKGKDEIWLSIDEYYREYSISYTVKKADATNYHVVDRGVEEVIAVWGRVDVEMGDRADFVEYEDSSEDNIISLEKWDDGDEYSVGHYIEEEDIKYLGQSKKLPKSSINLPSSYLIYILIFIAFLAVTFLPNIFNSLQSRNAIAKYLKTSSLYTYETSITGSKKEKADVYKTNMTVEDTAKDIIDAIEGATQDVTQNGSDNDNTISILTKYEYCLIYVSEDNNTLVQISSRKYTYHSTQSPYHSRYATNRFYRRYYRKNAYDTDYKSYKDYSPYSDTNDTDSANTSYDSSDDTTYYNSYSNSVRQASINSRSSSGGGTSSGK